MDIYEQLNRDEEKRPRIYDDSTGQTVTTLPSGGNVTAGVGRNLSTRAFSNDEIDLMLHNDVAAVVAELSPLAWWSGADDVRQWAIVNMAFNLGVPQLLHFPSMIHFFSLKDFQSAATAALDSDWAREEHYDPANPLASRPGRVAEQIRSGAWQ